MDEHQQDETTSTTIKDGKKVFNLFHSKKSDSTFKAKIDPFEFNEFSYPFTKKHPLR